MQERLDEIRALGAEPLGISVAADFQAEHLMNGSVDFELLLDPDRNFKTGALGFSKIRLWTYLTPKALWRYLKWATRTRQGVPTASLAEPPGVVLIDATGVVRYVYRGETLGDYPPIAEVLGQLRRIAA